MKKLLIIAFVGLLIMSCNNQPERYTTSSPEIDITKALVKDYTDGNWENWITHYSDSAKVHHNSIASMSANDLKEAFKASLLNYSSYNFSDKDLFYEMIIDDKKDTWVYFWGTWQATVLDTNKELQVPVHIALKFVDKKITEEYAYYDTASLSEAMKERQAAMALVEEIIE